MSEFSPRLNHVHRTPLRVSFVFVLISVIEFIPVFGRYAIGSSNLFFDAREVWIPLANNVLAGTPLYTHGAIDNKPPLWEYLNVLLAASGEYAYLGYFLVMLANAAAAILLYRWVADNTTDAHGIFAGGLFLAALPVIGGTLINVRSFALVGVLAALIVTHPAKKGVAIAVAGLFSQFAILAIPFLAYQGLQSRPSTTSALSWGARFVAAGMAIVAISFLPLLLVWGTDSLLGGIHYSFFIASEYITTHHALNPLIEPKLWAMVLVKRAERLWFVLLPAAGFVAIRYKTPGTIPLSRFERLTVGLAVVFLATLFIKSLPYYWMFPLPFLSALGAHTIVAVSNTKGE